MSVEPSGTDSETGAVVTAAQAPWRTGTRVAGPAWPAWVSVPVYWPVVLLQVPVKTSPASMPVFQVMVSFLAPL